MQASSSFGVDYNKELKLTEITKFQGYDTLQDSGKDAAMFKDNEAVDSVLTDEEAVIVLDKTPFYGEMGGQIGDTGVLNLGANNRFIVKNTKHVGQATIHIGRVTVRSVQPW